MPLIRLHKMNTFQWGIWQIEEPLEDLLGSFHLPNSYQHDISSFNSTQRQLEYIGTRVLLKHILGEEKEIGYHSNGKPFLIDHSYKISISHSGKYIAVIASPDYEVGIDIERYSERIDRLATRFMRLDEMPTLYDGELRWSYLLHWSAKEVLFKILNQQNVDFKKDLKVEPFQVTDCGVFYANELKTKEKKQFDIAYKIHPDFVLTWCVDK
ncbi:MAG: 4'-phosphopantetheinyl transferase superfamily protein [Bacteroidales bacterium]|nr:4'-phosphopantetheinyl transferase superfamily protein [Bacteroidales bacterium]